jgi:hypothetical protein
MEAAPRILQGLPEWGWSTKIRAVPTGTSPTKPPPTPMHVREAFVEAIESFANWYDASSPEPTIQFENGDISLSEACRMVRTCQVVLPKSSIESLAYADIHPTDRTYGPPLTTVDGLGVQ